MTEPRKPVCATCNDTHLMTQAREGDNDRTVMCTACPTPCQKCRKDGRGAYCARTPCRCACHVEGSATARARDLKAEPVHVFLGPPAIPSQHALTVRDELSAEVTRLRGMLRALVYADHYDPECACTTCTATREVRAWKP